MAENDTTVADETAAAPTLPPPSSERKLLGLIVGLTVFIAAMVLGVYLLSSNEHFPRTDDAYVQARYITVAAEVPGRIVELPVKEGSTVKAGDLLLQIDPRSYVLAVELAKAQILTLEAQITEARRQQKASIEMVEVARANTHGAQSRKNLAQSTYERMGPLAEQGFVTKESYDNAASLSQQADAGLMAAKSSELAAALAVPSLEALEAELKSMRITLAQAELALERTQVRAPFDGEVVNCNIAVGKMAMPGQPVFTLVDSSEWFVVANYRENNLEDIPVGATAHMYLHTLSGKSFSGTVVSVGYAVQTGDAFNFGTLPYVRNQLDWVRLAQRFPVRILVDDPTPRGAFRVGASATVVINKQ